MDIGELFKAARKAVGITQEGVEEAFGISQQWLSKLETTNAGDEETIRTLAAKLGIPSERVDAALANRVIGRRPKKRPESNVVPFTAPAAPTNISGTAALAQPRAEPKMIPILGHAAGALPGNGHLIMGEQRALVPCPPQLANVEGAYGVYVSGTSMLPRYQPGELLLVHPLREPSFGDYVVAQIEDEDTGELHGYVKKFIGWQGDNLVLGQHNPERNDLFFPSDLVRAIHKIVISVV